MKRAIFFYITITLLIMSSASTVSAQDDVYYDPNKDPGLQQGNESVQPSSPDNNTLSPTDKTDGYGNPSDNPAYRYDEAESSSYQQNGNTYVTNNYYEDDDDNAYYYTNRLRRYYSPNWGVNYYSYWFTPSYYYGWNNWNTSVTISLGSPWYQDPWWRWNNRHHSTVVIYDPWYDPYWSYNWGWSSCNYYNTWSNPYYGSGCGFNSWGYNGWGYHNGGFCGGYYNGYNYGYWNGYSNGYYDGYYNGYNNGWNQAYGNGNYYYGPRHRNTVPDQPGNNSVNNRPVSHPVVDRNPAGQPVNVVDIRHTDIPKEGIQRPIYTNKEAVRTTPGNGGMVNTDKSVPINRTGVEKPGVPAQSVEGMKNNSDRWSDKTQATPNMNVRQPGWNTNNTGNANNPADGIRNNEPKVMETKPTQSQPLSRDSWNNPSQGTPNGGLQKRPDIRTEPHPDYNDNQQRTQPRPNVNVAPKQEWNAPANNQPQPSNNYRQQQPRQEVRPQEQLRNYNAQPRQEIRNMEQPRGNFQAQPQREQRSISPSNNSGGGAKRRF